MRKVFQFVIFSIKSASGTNTTPLCPLIISSNRKGIVRDLFWDVMGNTKDCEVVPTTLIPEVDSKLARIFIPPFCTRINPDLGQVDSYGTRDSIFMTIGFDEETDDLVGLNGIRLWEVDHSREDVSSPKQMLEFDDATHRDAATQFWKMKRRIPSLSFGSVHYSSRSSHSACSA